MTARVLIGTSGYSYADWVGEFYPAGASKSDFLSYYANRFPIVELNFSYYRQPSAGLLDRLAAATPPSFIFTIKAHGSLTHKIEETWEDDAAIFKEGVGSLHGRGRLPAVLCQFPFSFHYTKANRTYLAGLHEALDPLPLVFEFRNSEWLGESVFEEMRRRGIGYATADYPELDGLPKASSVTTSDIGYVRMHGRNSAQWWTGTNASRYDYLYNENELSGWISRINEMAERTRMLVVVFNNHWRGKAVRNAEQLKTMLEKQTSLEIA